MLRSDTLVAGRYRLVQRVARGGMGSVWEAWDERLQRTVALKQLHPQPGLSASDAAVVRDRAMREARITARLHHPHAVPVYDVVDDDGQPCLVMQYLPSRSLAEVLREHGTLPLAEVARLGAQVASALAAAHQAGIVHRDVKPGNVLIDEHGNAKITDFGISHALGDVTLTSTGMVTGTPAFLAPEVARGDLSTPASDVFSLGATLYAAAEGVPPFGVGDNPMATLHRVASGAMDPPRRSGTLTPLLMRMLSHDPAGRPAMGEVERELQQLHRHLESGDATTAVASRGVPAAAGTALGVPPSTTVTLPPATPADAPPRHRRRAALLALLAVVLLGGLVTGIALAATGSGTPQPSQGKAGGSGTAPASHPVSPASVPATSSTTHTSPPAPASHSHPQPPPHAKPQPKRKPHPPHGDHGHGNGNGNDSAALSSAIENYYALLPGDTADAWPRLTPSYQHGTAESWSYYNSFWHQFSAVSTSDVTADPPSTVTATITYTRRDGSTSVERTTFGLVQQGGELKINSSQVDG